LGNKKLSLCGSFLDTSLLFDESQENNGVWPSENLSYLKDGIFFGVLRGTEEL
jgi:hypothetical protein